MHEHIEDNVSIERSCGKRAKADTAIAHVHRSNLASVQDTKSKASRGKKNDEAVEPNILKRVSSSGRVMYRVQIRRTVDGQMGSLCQTFRTLLNAQKWKKKLAEIELHGFPVKITSNTTVADAINKRLLAHVDLGRSAKQVLNSLKDRAFGKKLTSTLTSSCLYALCDELLEEDMLPQMAAGYLTTLVYTLDWAQRRGMIVPIDTLRNAISIMWEDEILARSAERERRPALDELHEILSQSIRNKRQRIPLATLVVFAIFSARRLSEICRLRWDDLRASLKKIKVRDMKHSRKKKGNDVWCNLTDESLQIIQLMPRTSEFSFPFNPKSVGTAFRRSRDCVKVVDLHFHDLRHEAISPVRDEHACALRKGDLRPQVGRLP